MGVNEVAITEKPAEPSTYEKSARRQEVKILTEMLCHPRSRTVSSRSRCSISARSRLDLGSISHRNHRDHRQPDNLERTLQDCERRERCPRYRPRRWAVVVAGEVGDRHRADEQHCGVDRTEAAGRGGGDAHGVARYEGVVRADSRGDELL